MFEKPDEKSDPLPNPVELDPLLPNVGLELPNDACPLPREALPKGVCLGLPKELPLVFPKEFVFGMFEDDCPILLAPSPIGVLDSPCIQSSQSVRRRLVLDPPINLIAIVFTCVLS